MSDQPHIIFYDDSCSLCDAEIEHYKKLATRQAISWLGIHSCWTEIEHYGLSKETLLRRIHAVRNDGVIVSGSAAFVLIWNSLQYYHRLGWVVSKLRLVPLMDVFYNYFAAWRYKKRKYCETR